MFCSTRSPRTWHLESTLVLRWMAEVCCSLTLRASTTLSLSRIKRLDWRPVQRVSRSLVMLCSVFCDITTLILSPCSLFLILLLYDHLIQAGYRYSIYARVVVLKVNVPRKSFVSTESSCFWNLLENVRKMSWDRTFFDDAANAGLKPLLFVIWVRISSIIFSTGRCKVFAEVDIKKLDYDRWFSMRLDVQVKSADDLFN